MLYSGFIEEKAVRCVWLANSKDAENWVQLKTPLVEPIEGEKNDLYGPSLLRWENRNFIVYQDHTAWRGGNVKYVEVDSALHPVGNTGERFVLIDPPPVPPVKDRYRGGEFYLENDTLYLYSSASSKPRIIVYATANAASDPSGKARTVAASTEKPPKTRRPVVSDSDHRWMRRARQIDQSPQSYESHLRRIGRRTIPSPYRLFRSVVPRH